MMSYIFMAKKKSWFGWVKRLFTSCESKDNKPRKWGSLGRFKQKQYPTITAPSRILIEASDEQQKHALTVAIATAAAAEAAVAAARAAAEVVKLTSAARSYSYVSKGDQSLAAIKIQSAFRGHLARKALRTLKGVIRLQAIVRGEAVRHRVSSSLNNLPCNSTNQSRIQERSILTPKQKMKLEEKEQNLQAEYYSQRNWDCSSHSREDIEAIWLRKQEAIAKRERMKQYSFSQRETKIPQMVEESVHNKEQGRESCRTLGQWLHIETCDLDVLYKPSLPSNLITMKQELQEGLSSKISIPRRSFSYLKRSSIGENESSRPSSPVFPTFMAVTESSKAKVRSVSTPRQRTRFMNVWSNQDEPHKEGIYFCSYRGASANTTENSEGYQQRCQSAKSYSYHQKM